MSRGVRRRPEVGPAQPSAFPRNARWLVPSTIEREGGLRAARIGYLNPWPRTAWGVAAHPPPSAPTWGHGGSVAASRACTRTTRPPSPTLSRGRARRRNRRALDPTVGTGTPRPVRQPSLAITETCYLDGDITPRDCTSASTRRVDNPSRLQFATMDVRDRSARLRRSDNQSGTARRRPGFWSDVRRPDPCGEVRVPAPAKADADLRCRPQRRNQPRVEPNGETSA